MIVRVEACVESSAAAWEASTAGADRLELCANLAEGGTTPDRETIAATLAGGGQRFHEYPYAAGIDHGNLGEIKDNAGIAVAEGVVQGLAEFVYRRTQSQGSPQLDDLDL